MSSWFDCWKGIGQGLLFGIIAALFIVAVVWEPWRAYVFYLQAPACRALADRGMQAAPSDPVCRVEMTARIKWGGVDIRLPNGEEWRIPNGQIVARRKL